MSSLTSRNALSTLDDMLAGAGFDRFDPDLRVFWDVYKAFAAVPAEDVRQDMDGDMLLFEASLSLRPPSRYDPEPHYSLDFTRQFSHEGEDGEYAGMEHLGCRFQFEPHPDFMAVTRAASWSESFRGGDQFWGSPRGVGEWVAEVEASPNFIAALAHQPRSMQVGQGSV